MSALTAIFSSSLSVSISTSSSKISGKSSTKLDTSFNSSEGLVLRVGALFCSVSVLTFFPLDEGKESP